jgi:hypothetical protein
MQKAFNKMGLLMADNALELIQTTISGYTDASDFQLGACIIQEWRLVAYFSHMLTKSD